MAGEQKTVQDYPRIDVALRCALPLIIRDAEHPQYPGIWGTAFAISYNRHVVFLTAKHLLRSVDGQSIISVPTVFGVHPVEVEMDSVSFRSTHDGDFQDAMDVALLVPPKEAVPFQEGETSFYDVGGLVANLVAAPIGCPLVVRGYPNGGNNTVNHAAKTFDFHAHSVSGRYRGPSGLVGVHKIDVDLTDVGGAQGFSGSPVLMPVFDDGDWLVGLAGMVLRGGDHVLHFLDVKALFAYLKTALGPLGEDYDF